MDFKSVGETAEFLGISTYSVYNLIKTGQLKSYKIVGKLKIPMSSIQEYLASCVVSNPK